jgi:hypothetical protein
MVKDDQPDLIRLFEVTIARSLAAEEWDSTKVESRSLRLQRAEARKLQPVSDLRALVFSTSCGCPGFVQVTSPAATAEAGMPTITVLRTTALDLRLRSATLGGFAQSLGGAAIGNRVVISIQSMSPIADELS